MDRACAQESIDVFSINHDEEPAPQKFRRKGPQIVCQAKLK